MKATTILASAVLAASSVTSTAVMAELSGNIGFTSNYLWRGVTQSNDEAAISGGIDYAHESGFYAGTWVSNLAGAQYEQDWYAGYGFAAGEVDLDAGYIAYTYPVGNANLDFSEVYLNAGYQAFSAGLAYTVDTDWGGQDSDLYLHVGAEFEVKKDLMLGLVYGDYDFDDPATEDYAHWQVSLSKDDFTFALDKNDKTDTGAGEDDMRFSVSYSKSFDL